MRTHLTRILVVLCIITTALIIYISARNETLYTPSEKQNEVITIYKKIESHNNEIIKISKQLRSGIVKPSEEAKVLQIASERKKYMSYLIEKDPTLAMERVIRNTDKEILPSSVKPFIEDEISTKGTIEIFHEDYPKQKTSKESYFLKTGSETLQLAFAHGIPTLQPNQTIEAKGAQLDRQLLTLTTSSQPNVVLAATTPTTKKIGVILFNFANDTTKPETIEQIQDLLTTNSQSVNQFIQESSYGQVKLITEAADIKGWYTIPFDNTSCNYHQWTNNDRTQNALSQAIADNFNPNNYDHIIYISPFVSACGFSGTASVGGKYIYMNGLYFPNIRESAHQISHELGHNLGLWHAHMLNCKGRHGEPTVIDGMCDVEEFGDPIDRMGSGDYTYNGINRSRLSWLLNSNIQTISQPGSYTLYSIEPPSTQTQLLKIPRIKDENIYVEYRKSFSIDTFPSTSVAEQGVSIRLGSDTNNGLRNSIMLDTTPLISQNPRGFLTLNKTFFDPLSGIGIIVTNINTDSATVLVKKNTPQCIISNPAIDITPNDQKLMPTQSASYTMTVTNMDSTGCLPSSFEWKTILSDYQKTQPENTDWQKITLTPGEILTKTFTITALGNATGGIYPFQQIVHHYPQTQYEATVAGTLQVVLPETPYYGDPLTIPGTIQTEDFDNGGELTAYHDNEKANLGGQYRTNESVDISTTQDVGGGFAVSSIRAGEWVKYTVNIAQTGNYTANFRVALSGGTSTFHMEVDDQDVTGQLTIPNTKDWNTWTTISQKVSLPGGNHILKLVMDTASINGYVGNMNYFSIDAINEPTLTPTPTITNTPTPSPIYIPPPANTPTPTLTPTPTQPVSSVDITPPTLTIASPQNNAIIRQYIISQLAATASDASGIQSITIIIDGNLSLKTCTNATNCTAYYNFKSGNHTITFKAIDKATPVANVTTKTINVRKM